MYDILQTYLLRVISFLYPLTFGNNNLTLKIRYNSQLYLNAYDIFTKAAIQYLNETWLVMPCAWEINDPASFRAGGDGDQLKEFRWPTKLIK